jgi:GR25 family glycosyltransferase involved in LPS biosynthesis
MKGAEDAGVADKIIRHFGVYFPRSLPYNHQKIGHMGCALAHKNILKIARENKAKRILVFEDDAKLKSSCNAIVHKSIAELPDDWKLLYLSATLDWKVKSEFAILPYSEHLYIMQYSRGTHAIAYNESTFDVFDKIPEDHFGCHDWVSFNKPIDIYLCAKHAGEKKSFITNPIGVMLNNVPSEITTSVKNPDVERLFYSRVSDIRKGITNGSINPKNYMKLGSALPKELL